jgi:hypothetical protein
MSHQNTFFKLKTENGLKHINKHNWCTDSYFVIHNNLHFHYNMYKTR